MAATQVESFCERCGTKYTFDQRVERGRLLKGLGRTLGFLAEEGSPEDVPAASRDPFHGTFRFCLECRQYTCPSCWNEAAGFCQGCAPLAHSVDMTDAEAFAAVEAASDLRDAMSQVNLLRSPEAWPGIDLQPVSLMEPATNGHKEPVASERAMSFALDEYDAMPSAPLVAATDELFAGPWDAFADDGLGADEPEGDWSVVPAPELSEPVDDGEVIVDESEPMAAMSDEAEPELEFAADADEEAELELVAESELDAETAAEPEHAAVFELDAETAPEPETESLPLAAATAHQPETDVEPEPLPPAPQPRPVPSLLTPITELPVGPRTPEPVTPSLPPMPPPLSAPPSFLPASPSWMAPPSGTETRPSSPTQPAPQVLPATPPMPLSVPPPPPPAASLFAQPSQPSMTPSAVPASRFAALFGRSRKQEPAPPPMPPPGALPSGWRITAEDTTPQYQSAAFLPQPQAPVPPPQPPRPSLLVQPGHAHATPGIRPCYQCSLPLSSTARFCRRCGTPQQPSV